MYSKLTKRIIDFLLAFIGIIILLPVLTPVIIILVLTGEHKVFYRQTRVGFKNKLFRIWKFNTMRSGSSKMGSGDITLRNDPRVLPFGRFLRQTKINEIPQIINVLTGEMSFVGPRPLMKVGFEKYPQHVQNVIYNTHPGITGIGSIVFRDEEYWVTNAKGDKQLFYKDYIKPYKGKLELWYQKNISFYTDSMIIFLTAWAIVAPESDLVYKIFKDLPEKPEWLNNKVSA